MSEFLDEIKQIVKNHNPKSVSGMIKKRSHLYEWLMENTPDCDTLSERIYIAINGVQVCPNGKRYKFSRGKLTYCGHQSICQCSKESTKQNVILSKKNISDDDKKKSDEKRKRTNEQRYGHSYFSQSEEYKESLLKNSLEKYGTTSANKKHIKPEYVDILENKEKFKKFISDKTYKECIEELNIWYGTFNNYLKKYDLYDYSNSYLETDMSQFLDSINVKYIQNNRSVISPKEVDFYLPEHNLAIEMHGLYWHTLQHVSKDYHYEKYKIAKHKGVNLIQIFEDEWNDKQEIVKQRILHKLGKNTQVVYARKCVIKNVENGEAKDFLNNHHIQGYAQSSIKMGLYHNNVLVALMTFGNKRAFMNSKGSKHDYELIRYVTNGSNVVGGASRLFKNFIKEYNPSTIISYSDNRWNTGSLYQQLGMTFDGETGAGYFYVIDNKREHRYNYTKAKLVKEGYDRSLTEKQIMENQKYFQIWDCGSKRWLWKKG